MHFNLCLLILLISKFQSSSQEDDDKPNIQDLFASSKVVESKKLFLACQAAGKPSLQFEWFFKNQKIQPDDNVFINHLEDSSLLNIKSMSIDNAGEYTCKVSNSFGSDSKKVHLNLNSK